MRKGNEQMKIAQLGKLSTGMGVTWTRSHGTQAKSHLDPHSKLSCHGPELSVSSSDSLAEWSRVRQTDPFQARVWHLGREVVQKWAAGCSRFCPDFICSSTFASAHSRLSRRQQCGYEGVGFPTEHPEN